MPITESEQIIPAGREAEVLETALAQVMTPDAAFGPDINHLASRAGELAAAFVAHGDAFAAGEEEEPDNLAARLTHFVWADRAKHFLILYRNVQLELQMASLKVREGQVGADRLADLHERTATTLRSAVTEWEAELAALQKQYQDNERSRTAALETWAQQRNPWPEYRMQLVATAQQAQELGEEYALLLQQIGHFSALRELLRESARAARTGIESSIDRASETLSFILAEDGGEKPQPGKIASRLDDLLAEDNARQQIHHFTNKLTTLIGALAERTRITVGAEHGLLQYKDVNLQRAADQWVAAEILPQLYELWELSEAETTGLDVAMANVRNRALLLDNEQKAGAETQLDLETLCQPLYNFLARAESTLVTFTEIEQLALGLIEKDLRLTTVYRPEAGFLPLPLQSGINEFTRRQGRLLDNVKAWFDGTFAGLQRWRGAAAQEDRMSVSEKLVRAINQRQPAPGNGAYTNILLTKGYIGESFLVGREDETERLRRLINNWTLGFRGAVMLTGRRLSGKTLFGELIANRVFPNTVIRLRPASIINLQGRRLVTTGNLAEALEFIEKYTLQSKPMIWIDDLETWHDKNTTLAENVRSLTTHIDDFSGRIFFMVSTTNAVWSHLNKFMGLEKIFQAEVNLDTFSLAEMHQAILIRHGATHKQLVDQEGEPLGEVGFSRRVRRLYRAANGNIGDTLNYWAWHTHYVDENRVTPGKDRHFRLPAFVSADTGILLNTLYLERRTSEYRLRKLLGPAFEHRYRSILRRLLRVGMLTRHNDGGLEISESIVNDVARALEHDGYLNQED